VLLIVLILSVGEVALSTRFGGSCIETYTHIGLLSVCPFAWFTFTLLDGRFAVAR
jgi:hypothetical protein